MIPDSGGSDDEVQHDDESVEGPHPQHQAETPGGKLRNPSQKTGGGKVPTRTSRDEMNRGKNQKGDPSGTMVTETIHLTGPKRRTALKVDEGSRGSPAQHGRPATMTRSHIPEGYRKPKRSRRRR